MMTVDTGKDDCIRRRTVLCFRHFRRFYQTSWIHRPSFGLGPLVMKQPFQLPRHHFVTDP